jgi:drug/metabolite transporter (DMT)-like permease
MSIRQRKQQQQQSGQAQQADDDQALQKPATNRSSGSWSLQPLGLLCTGTTLMVLGQYINMQVGASNDVCALKQQHRVYPCNSATANTKLKETQHMLCVHVLQAAIDPNAQLLVLMRYVFAFALSAVNCARESQAAHQHRNVSSTSTSTSTSKAAQDVSQQQPQCAVSRPAVPTKVKLLLLLMGMLDLASYAIFNIGYAAAGSALAAVVLAATGQICTAVLSVALLHRQLSCKHLAAVTIVTLGLVLRSADDLDLNSVVSMFSGAKAGSSSDSSSNSTSAANGMDGKALLGVGCVALSALLFSVLGCMYEVLMAADQAHSVTQAQVGYAVC